MCSPAMTGGGAAGVGKGLGAGMTEAFTGIRVAQEDIHQGKAPMQDPRLMEIYGSLGTPIAAEPGGFGHSGMTPDQIEHRKVLWEIINTPGYDPNTKREAQRMWIEMQKGQVRGA